MKIKSFKPKVLKNISLKNLNYTKSVVTGKLKLIPLGGIGEVTKNLIVYEYGDDIVIVDCGVGFPEEGMLGIDLVIPDITYLKDKRHKIKGFIISHAHDDHIGGLPYIWPEIDAPIYATKLTSGLIRAKFIEHNLPKERIKTINVEDSLTLGSFQVSFYAVTHSVPDAVGIVLRTPVGTIIHQADFKIDWTPVSGSPPDVAKIAQIGSQGVLFMTMDCLRVEKEGWTLSEQTIEPTFADVERETKGKLLITMTSSNVTRMQQAINVAFKAGRKVALSGRSMESNFQVARDLGYLDVPPGMVIAQDEIKRFPDSQVMILIAGSQGQDGSALSRVANGDHKFVFIGKDDSIVFSADPIPSTETAQNALIDNLTRLGCNVYYSQLTSDLHVSGHAAKEELKLMINLAKPKYILPIGGTFRHMKAFSKLAQSLGYNQNQILLTENGQVIEVGSGKAYVNGKVDVSNVYIDGLGVGDVGNIVLRDRQVMAEDGIVVVIVPVVKSTGEVGGEPDIITRGFVYEKHAEDLIDAGKRLVRDSIRDHFRKHDKLDWRYLRSSIEESLERLFYKETNRRPMILPVVVDL